MIIACQKCNKNFDIDHNLIPEKGRLLQCNSCNHKWFFKKEIAVKKIELPINENMEIFETKKHEISYPVDVNNSAIIDNEITPPIEEIVKKVQINNTKIKKKSNLLNLAIVFIISFVTLIILLDTFKNPLGKIVPNLEFLLYNLYESIIDIKLFIKDLI